MSTENKRSDRVFKVVVNHEDQYSLWSTDREIPTGWSDAGIEGPREECLAYIREVWTDMRPKSLRECMDTDLITD
jgi:MbtH protein